MFFSFMMLLVIIGVGVVSGVLLFYGDRYDVRALEARIIFDKVFACAEKNDFFADDFRLEKCGLLEGAFRGEHLIYIKRNDGIEKYFGNYDFIVECELEGLKERQDGPVCLNEDIENEFGSYKIIVGSKQNARRTLE
ncbi:MAG: hypothetical protein AABW79_01945 [Nanoarchaeota archaeon]